jgi:hypothetical protein
MVSKKAINFLTKCMWANLPDIFTPNKLRPVLTPTCLNFEQVALPIMHPTTVGETISSYKWMMHDSTTAETWQTAFRILGVWRKAI